MIPCSRFMDDVIMKGKVSPTAVQPSSRAANANILPHVVSSRHWSSHFGLLSPYSAIRSWICRTKTLEAHSKWHSYGHLRIFLYGTQSTRTGEHGPFYFRHWKLLTRQLAFKREWHCTADNIEVRVPPAAGQVRAVRSRSYCVLVRCVCEAQSNLVVAHRRRWKDNNNIYAIMGGLHNTCA